MANKESTNVTGLESSTNFEQDDVNSQNGEDERISYAVHGVNDFLKIAGGVKFPADEHSGGGNGRN